MSQYSQEGEEKKEEGTGRERQGNTTALRSARIEELSHGTGKEETIHQSKLGGGVSIKGKGKEGSIGL